MGKKDWVMSVLWFFGEFDVGGGFRLAGDTEIVDTGIAVVLFYVLENGSFGFLVAF
jgi:hypothetical protein